MSEEITEGVAEPSTETTAVQSNMSVSEFAQRRLGQLTPKEEEAPQVEATEEVAEEVPVTESNEETVEETEVAEQITTEAKKIISNSHGIIYFISQLSTTGSKLKVSPKRILKNYNRIKRMARGKFVILGFGITEKTIGKFKKSDAIVVGSACCKIISDAVKKKHSPAIKLGLMIKRLKNKIK